MASGFRQQMPDSFRIVRSFGATRRPDMTATMMDDLDTLMTGREAASLLRLSERTLERHRTAGTGPRYAALGRAIRYRRRDLLDWIESGTRQSTSEPAR